jgi:hypothetical protein
LSIAETGTSLQPSTNNVITSGKNVASKMINSQIYNQYMFKTETGNVDLMVITHFSRSIGQGPVTVNKVEVKYTNTSNGTPYFSSLFLDKRDGSKMVVS